MHITVLLAALVAVQQAAAWGDSQSSWSDCSSLPSCQQASNKCTDQQKQGLDLSSAKLPEGSCSSYAGFDLQGLSYGSFGGKKARDLFPRGGGSSSKCLQGSVSKSSGPSISCGASIPEQKASITNMQVSVDKDTDVQFIHSYEGSDKTCSYVKSCSSKSVNSIENTQCGGSTSVKCQLPPSSPHDTCNIGVHSVGFDCTPGQQQSSAPVSPPMKTSTPVSPPKGTAPASGPKSSSPAKSAPFPVPSSPSSSAHAGTAPAPVPSSVHIGTAPVASSPAKSVPAPSSPAKSAPATTSAPLSEVATTAPVKMSTVEQVTSEIVYTTVTSCPVSKTLSQGGSTIVSVVTELSTVKITSTMTICTRCVAPQKTASSTPAVSAVPAPSSAPKAPSSPAPAPSSAAPVPSSSPVESQVATTAPAPSSAAPVPSSSPMESEVATTAPAPSSAPPAPPAVPQTTESVVETEIVYTTLTTCPVTHTVTPSHGTPIVQVTSTTSTVISTVTSTICTQCIAPQKSAPPPPPASSAPAVASQVATTIAPPAVVATSSTPAASPSAPSVLPSCLKTWVSVTKCKDNSDYDCFCKNDVFTQSVYECISAWEADVAKQQAAMSLYAGLCAPHIPAHPVIVTAVPTTITLVPTPMSAPSSSAPPAPAANSPAPTPAPGTPAAAAPAGSAPAVPAAAPAGTIPPAQAAATLPQTTISLSTTITLPCPSAGAVNQITDGQIQAATPMPSGCMTTSLLQTAVTVPQVALSTGPSSSVGLVAGPAPAQAAATSAPAAGVPGVAAGSSSAVIASPTGSTTPFTGVASRSGSSIMLVLAAAAGLFVFA